ncbi:hypothetical protein [Isoptericola sp. NPDC057559]|uniref:hypothetical protein n=1 Tax=Isoptericola sp. NPDC057559 TaxID=3346168 RepID=UPI00368151A8
MSTPAIEVDERGRTAAHRSRLRRVIAASVASALALAASLVLIPGPEGESAPRFNVQCDVLVDGIEGIADAAELPGGGLPDAYEDTIDDYEFDSPGEKLRPLEKPTQADLDALTGSYEDYPPGTKDHMLRRWKVYEGDYTWERWRNTYIPAISNDYRGDGFQKNVAKRLKLGGADWMCEDDKLWQEEKLDTRRRYDSVNRTLKIAYELKSGDSSLKMDQLRADQALRAKGWRVVYIFSQDPKPGQVKLLKQFGVEHAKLHSTGVPKTPPAPSGDAMDPRCGGTAARVTALSSTCPRRSTAGPAKQLANESGRNAASAREAQQIRADIEQDNRRPGFGSRRPGGVDWRSLELRYVSDDPKADDYSYAFSADELPDDGEAEPGYGGEAALDLSSDALMTWLALDPSQFWVNLNPDTPETIIDEQFATTDAGRVLLEADLAMKKTLTEIMRPETPTGQEFWDTVERTDDGLICWDWTRAWIEPQPAKVRADGDQLYILDAPLRVQVEPMDIDWTPPDVDDPCADAPADLVKANTEYYAEYFGPLLEERVNADPEYADMRRVYTTRVAAEWIKDRDAKRPGAFHDVIGSGDVSDWPARTPWDPQVIFDELMVLLQTPQFRYEYQHGEMDMWVEVFGGIELPDAPRAQTPKAEFDRDHPRLPRTVHSSRFEAASLPPEVAAQGDVSTLAEETGTAWLGGGTFAEPDEPDPTDPPDGPDPTEPPDPTTPPGGGNGSGGGNGGDGPGSDDGGGTSGRGDGPGQDLPEPPQADPPQGEQAPQPGELASTGFAQGWLVPAAIVLVLAGLVLVGVRRRWFPRP